MIETNTALLLIILTFVLYCAIKLHFMRNQINGENK